MIVGHVPLAFRSCRAPLSAHGPGLIGLYLAVATIQILVVVGSLVGVVDVVDQLGCACSMLREPCCICEKDLEGLAQVGLIDGISGLVAGLEWLLRSGFGRRFKPASINRLRATDRLTKGGSAVGSTRGR